MLKLVPPRTRQKNNSPNWTIRGTYLGVKIDQTSGTHRKAVAKQKLRELETAIERGDFGRTKPITTKIVTFTDAATAYIEAGRRPRHVLRLSKHFGETPLSEITQETIDAAAFALCPTASPATRNASVYTPTSAILRHAGIKTHVRRPKGHRGKIKSDFLSPDDAFAIIASANTVDAELGLLLKFLLYTGCRLGEALSRTWDDINLEHRTVRLGFTKNGDPRTMLMREDLCAQIASHKSERHRLFRFLQGGYLRGLLLNAKLKACGLAPLKLGKRSVRKKRVTPPYRLSWVTFHTFRHTWASWMRRYAKVDLQGLVATGNWRDARSAARYAHVVPREEWAKVEQLPAMKKEIG